MFIFLSFLVFSRCIVSLNYVFILCLSFLAFWLCVMCFMCVCVIISLRNRSSYISKVMGFDAMIVCVCLYAKNKGLTKICVFGMVALCVFSFGLFIYVKRCCLLFYQYLCFVMCACVYLCWITIKPFLAHLSSCVGWNQGKKLQNELIIFNPCELATERIRKFPHWINHGHFNSVHGCFLPMVVRFR